MQETATSTHTTPRSRPDTWALTGLLFSLVTLVTTFVIGLVITGERPRPSAPDVAVQNFVLENATALRMQAVAGVAGGVLLVLFAVSLAAMVRRLQESTTGTAEVTLAGGILAAALWSISSLLLTTMGDEMINNSPALASALRTMNFFTGGSGHVIWLALLLGPASLAAQRMRIMPRWLTTAGIVSAVMSILSLGALATSALAIFIPLGRFSAVFVIGAMSVLMLTGRVVQNRAGGSILSAVLGAIGIVILAFATTIFI